MYAPSPHDKKWGIIALWTKTFLKWPSSRSHSFVSDRHSLPTALLHFRNSEIRQYLHFVKSSSSGLITICVWNMGTERMIIRWSKWGLLTSLGKNLFKYGNRSSRIPSSTKKAPVTQAYVGHLLARSHQGSFGEGVATVLPCTWIYFLVGKRLAESTPKDPFYAEWVKTYNTKDIEANVNEELEVISSVAHRADRDEKERMRDNYHVSMRYTFSGIRHTEWILGRCS